MRPGFLSRFERARRARSRVHVPWTRAAAWVALLWLAVRCGVAAADPPHDDVPLPATPRVASPGPGVAPADAVGAPPPAPLEPPGSNGAARPAGGSRSRVALVFSGGGARGFAQIGVLQVLEQMHVPVDIVAGTSMGAIVGGAYAAGYTPLQLAGLVASTDWKTMFAGRAPRAEIDWRRKEDDFNNLSRFEFGVRHDGLTLPQALVGSQGLELFLRRLGGPARDIRDLTELPIPFVAMATDLTNGQAVALQKDISLSTAMRASMAVPGAFAPLAVEGKLLVDGGLTDNLPVDQALAMGADVIIAVDCSTPLLPRERLGDVVGVAEQLSLLLGLDSKQRQIAKLRPTDILLSPDLGAFRSADFGDYDKIIEAGRDAARAVADKLMPFAVGDDEWAGREEGRTRLVHADEPVEIANVAVRQMTTVNANAVKEEIEVKAGQTVTTDDIERDIDRVYRTGDFEAVDYGIVGDGPRRTLVIAPYEKSWGYNTLRFGGGFQTNFRDDNTFNLLIAQTWRWLDSWGGEWRNTVQIGEPFQLATELYQPIGPGSPWYVLPRLQRLRTTFRSYAGTKATSESVNSENTAQLLLGHALPGLGTVELGFARSELTTTQVIGVPSPVTPPAWGNDFIAHLRFDRLDTVNFPHHGYYFDAGITGYGSTVGSAEKKTAYTIELDKPLTLGHRFTAYLTARDETAVQQSGVQLGGLFNLSGTAVGAINGTRSVLLRSIMYENITSALGDLPMPIYTGVSLEAGNALGPSVDLSFSSLRRAGALFVGADSPVGPLYLALGHTVGGSTGLYLLLGRPR